MSRFLRKSDGPGDDYLRAVAGPAAPAVEPDELDVPVDVVIAPDASTVDELVARLDRLRGGRLVGPHRIVVATITTPTALPAGQPIAADPADRVGSDPDRLSDRPPLALGPGPTVPDPAPPALDSAPPTAESVALQIGRLNGRPVTADQLRYGLRIAPDRARGLRDYVNAELFPERNGGLSDD